MPDPLANVAEVFSAPIESIIGSLAKGISDAQSQLDRNSIATQAAIDADPALSGLGVQATWYQFPRVDMILKISMTVVEDTTSSSDGSPIRRRIYLQPVSAAFANHFNYTAEASSTISLAIVPVPSPAAAVGSVVAPALTLAAVQAAAFATVAKFAKVTSQGGALVPDPKFRFDVNYNASSRQWFVLQYDPLNMTATPAVVVAVDDRTQQTRVISSP